MECPTCGSKGSLYVWHDKDVFDDEELGGPAEVERMVRCRNEQCDFTSCEARHIVMIERLSSSASAEITTTSPAAAASSKTTLPFKPSLLLSQECPDKTRRKVDSVVNKTCERIESVCEITDLQVCKTLACDNFRFLSSQFSISKPNAPYAAVACMFVAWTTVLHVASVDANVFTSVGRAVDNVFQCASCGRETKKPFSVREHAKKHINKFMGILRTRPVLGTTRSVEPIQYCKDVMAMFRTSVGTRLVLAGVGEKRAREEGEDVLAEARTVARRVAERIDSSLDIPSGCKSTICLSIAAHAVAMKFARGPEVTETARQIAAEKGVQESFNRRHDEIGLLVDKFSR